MAAAARDVVRSDPVEDRAVGFRSGEARRPGTQRGEHDRRRLGRRRLQREPPDPEGVELTVDPLASERRPNIRSTSQVRRQGASKRSRSSPRQSPDSRRRARARIDRARQSPATPRSSAMRAGPRVKTGTITVPEPQRRTGPRRGQGERVKRIRSGDFHDPRVGVRRHSAGSRRASFQERHASDRDGHARPPGPSLRHVSQVTALNSSTANVTAAATVPSSTWRLRGGPTAAVNHEVSAPAPNDAASDRSPMPAGAWRQTDTAAGDQHANRERREQ